MNIYDAEVRVGLWTAVDVMGSNTAQSARTLDAVAVLLVDNGATLTNDWRRLANAAQPSLRERLRSWADFEPYQSGWTTIKKGSLTHVMFQLSRSAEYFGVTLGRAEIGETNGVENVWQTALKAVPELPKDENRTQYPFLIYALEFMGTFEPDKVTGGVRFEKTDFGFAGAKRDGNHVTWWVAFDRAKIGTASQAERDYCLNEYIPLASHHWLRTVDLLNQTAKNVTTIAHGTGRDLAIVPAESSNLAKMEQISTKSTAYLDLFDAQMTAELSHRQAMANLHQLEKSRARLAMGAAWPNLVANATQIGSHLQLLQPVLAGQRERLELSEREATTRVWPLLIALSVLAGVSACVDLATMLVPEAQFPERRLIGLVSVGLVLGFGWRYVRAKS